MPSKNSIKQFATDSLYHVYNRGVGKADVFLDQQDYRAFLRRFELMLLPPDEADHVQTAKQRIRLENYYGRLKLQAYCLMPNHFHILIWQEDPEAITQFMRTLSTSYAMYFNRKYERVGPLFQGRFKASHVNSDAYLMHLSRYIHCNPRSSGEGIYGYPYSSLQYYFKPSCPHWLEAGMVQQLFSDENEYVSFVNDLVDLQKAEEEFSLN